MTTETLLAPARPIWELQDLRVQGPETTLLPTVIISNCKVPGCRNPACSLKSHLLYASDQRTLHSKYGSTRGRSFTPVMKAMLQAVQRGSPIENGLSSFLALPIGDANDKALQGLFQHFFVAVFDRLAMLFRGPTMRNIEEHKKRMLSVALNDQVYCLGLIMQAHTDIASAQQQRHESLESLILYAKTVQVFKDQIATLLSKPAAKSVEFEVELALLNVCILLAYDQLYARKNTLILHWHGLQSLVALKGGIYNITVSLPYVIHVDRMCAVFLGKLPAYTSPASMLLQLPQPTWNRYGNQFSVLRRESDRSFSSDVIQYCIMTCNLLDVWELKYEMPDGCTDQNDAFVASLTSAEYLYCLRDRVDEYFAILNARGLSNTVQERCLLLATRIVEHQVTWNNYYITNNIKHYIEICDLLQGQSILQDWQNHLDMLRWTLFVVTTAPMKQFEARSWALATLKKLIMVANKADELEPACRLLELDNVDRFVWDQSHFSQAFNLVWTELINTRTPDIAVLQAAWNSSENGD